MGTPPAVRVESLEKRFETRRGWKDAILHPRSRSWSHAVRGVGFEAAAGEILGLLGPNGAGKTTLLKMLSTLIVPDSGRAQVCGFDVVRDAARVRQLLAPVGADERSLEWRLSARENLRFFGALHGLRGVELEQRVDAQLTYVGLDPASTKLVGSFSSGMRQRLLIARALFTHPRVLLLDEPTRSLDPVGARDLRTFIRRELAGKQGATVLLATHDPEEALELCDRLLVLDRGRLLATGTPADLLSGFGDEEYNVWTRTPGHPAFAAIAAHTPARAMPDDRDGYAVLRLRLRADLPAPENALSFLIDAGAVVARFEKIKPTLADLLERVVGNDRKRRDA